MAGINPAMTTANVSASLSFFELVQGNLRRRALSG